MWGTKLWPLCPVNWRTTRSGLASRICRRRSAMKASEPCQHSGLHARWRQGTRDRPPSRGFTEFSGRPEATLIGRGQRADILLATLVNAHSQGVNAYNDTHLAKVAHPTGPVAAPVLASSERQPVTGPEFLHALILGIEIQLRVGNILVTPPAKCPVGVSTQSILGVIGAAVASAKLLRLSEQQMVWAIGLATAQAAGHRET